LQFKKNHVKKPFLPLKDERNFLISQFQKIPWGDKKFHGWNWKILFSNAHFVHFQVKDHLFYFGKDVDGYGTQGCPDEPPTRTMMPSSSLLGR
jgi:hypothetical protein